MKIVAMFDHHERVGPESSQCFREAKSFDDLEPIANIFYWAKEHHGEYQNITIVREREPKAVKE